VIENATRGITLPLWSWLARIFRWTGHTKKLARLETRLALLVGTAPAAAMSRTRSWCYYSTKETVILTMSSRIGMDKSKHLFQLTGVVTGADDPREAPFFLVGMGKS